MWRTHFPEFWPKGNRFAGALTGINPGDVALLDLSIGGGVKLSTGVFVLYADAESFTLMTPQGHMFAGWITFSAERAGDVTMVQAQVLMRANDPIYEIGMTLGGHRKEDKFWTATLTALGHRLGVPDPVVETRSTCVDSKRQWRHASNVWHNSAIRTMLQTSRAGERPRRVSSTAPRATPSQTWPGAHHARRTGRGGRRQRAERPGRRGHAGRGGPEGAPHRGRADDRRRLPDRGADAARLLARRLLRRAPAGRGVAVLPALRPGRAGGHAGLAGGGVRSSAGRGPGGGRVPLGRRDGRAAWAPTAAPTGACSARWPRIWTRSARPSSRRCASRPRIR